MSDYNTPVITEFRKNQGIVAGSFSGMKLLLMTTHGAKTNKEMIIPVVYTKDGDNYVIIASKGGAPTNPGWYYNLLAHPSVTVEVGEETFAAHAQEATGKERDRLFEQHAAQYPNFNEYKAKTTRVLPVFLLVRD